MALTITNSNTLQLLRILNQNAEAQRSSLLQLSTGKRINTGKDDPAGLIAISNLAAERIAVQGALTNNQRTDSILSVADSSITEISNLLNEISTLVSASTSSANLSDSEIAANQSQIDDALDAIDRIVNTTNFNGKKLIDGSLAIDTSGTSTTTVNNLRVFSRSNATTDSVLTATRVASAQLATATFSTMTGVAATVRTSGTTLVSIKGSLGTATITLTSGLTQTQVVTAINAAKDQTGVSALQNATSIGLNSTTFGKDAFISVNVLSGGIVNSSYTTATTDGSTANDAQITTKNAGVDANITINGQQTGADGLDISYSANGLSLEFTLAQAFGEGNTAGTTAVFTVLASGGATYQLGTNSSTRRTIGIDSLAAFNLAGSNGTVRLSELRAGGAADLRTNTEGAFSAVKEAIQQVASTRGRIGGFQKFQVGSAIKSLQAADAALGDAVSAIGDTDFAAATARLNSQTVLVQSTIQLLGIANQQASQILSLL